jgi:hypothetical protein
MIWQSSPGPIKCPTKLKADASYLGAASGSPAGIQDPPHFILFITFFVTILILNFEINN